MIDMCCQDTTLALDQDTEWMMDTALQQCHFASSKTHPDIDHTLSGHHKTSPDIRKLIEHKHH